MTEIFLSEYQDVSGISYLHDNLRAACAACDIASRAGCNADGIHVECRFCDAKPFLDVPCPPEVRPPYPTDECLGCLSCLGSASSKAEDVATLQFLQILLGCWALLDAKSDAGCFG